VSNRASVHQSTLCKHAAGTLCVGRAQVTAVIHSAAAASSSIAEIGVCRFCMCTASNSHAAAWGVTLLENISVAALEILNSQSKSSARHPLKCALRIASHWYWVTTAIEQLKSALCLFTSGRMQYLFSHFCGQAVRLFCESRRAARIIIYYNFFRPLSRLTNLTKVFVSIILKTSKFRREKFSLKYAKQLISHFLDN